MIPLEQNEEVLLEVRKHWFILFVETVGFLILALVPFILFSEGVTTKIYKFVGISLGWGFLGAFLAASWFLLLWVGFFIRWTTYILDVLILTNKRVVYVNQQGLFSRRVSTSRLDRVQDVASEVAGVIPTLLNFGTITVQTAAEEREFIIRGIPNPIAVKEQILATHHKAIAEPQRVTLA